MEKIYIKDVTHYLEGIAPLALQESYDNSGMLTGNAGWECKGLLVCLDCLESVVDEAISTGCNLIVAHHPILFTGLKSLTGKNYIEQVLIKAIKNDIAIYAIHTNLDNVSQGVNREICRRLGLDEPRILQPKKGILSKFITYGIPSDIEKIRDAIFRAGGGLIGDYSECSFSVPGQGTFKPGRHADPAVGEIGVRQHVGEQKLEVIMPSYLVPQALRAAREASSYEELGYDVVPLSNPLQEVGSGMIADLGTEMEPLKFLDHLKEVFRCKVIRHTALPDRRIKKVAVCGGSGSFLLQEAINRKADVLVTADFKYHQFFDAEGKIIIADIGHFESEQFTIDLLADKLKRKFTTFAVRLTSVNTNPVNYY